MLELPAKVEAFAELSAFLEGHLEGVEAGKRNALLIAAEEIFVNIAHYAYGNGAGMAVCRMERREGEVVLEFSDSGIAFDPLARAAPDTSLSAEERVPGGLGIFMVKKMTDGQEYARRDGRNVLRLRKSV